MTDLLDEWIEALAVRGDAETAGDHVVRIVRACDGISLHNHADELAALFRRIEGDNERARRVSTWATNCATFADAALTLAGAPPGCRLLDPLRVGVAMTQLREGAKAGRLPGTQWRSLRAGWLMIYWSGAGNDAHAEFCLTTPDAVGVAEHGGGGRPDNAITCSKAPESILWSHGRRLQEIYDPERIATAPDRRYLPGIPFV